MAIRQVKATYIKEIAPLVAKMQTTNDRFSSMQVKKLDDLFKERVSNIQWQGIASVGFSLAGGAASITGAALNMRVLKVVARIVSKGGDVAGTFLRADDVKTESSLTKVREHVQPSHQKLQNQTSEFDTQLVRTLNQLQQEEDSQYRLK